VIGNEQSIINGAINANGQVFIVNSAGVLFGKGSQVNVGGIVASTLDISNSDFMAGNYKFSGTSNASVVNQGRIRAHGGGEGGGYVALLGKTVSNEGMIAARLGTVAMAAGEKITLNFGGDSLVDVTIDKGTLNALVQSKRAIIANGGQVIMTARAADQVLSAQVNNSGVIQARTMAALKGGSNGGGTVRIGKIKLLAHGGTTNVSGKLDASAPKGGNGGFIETSGDHVKVADGAVVTTLAPSGSTGTWLIDPTDFNIVAGNAAQTTSGIGSGTLASILASTNFAVMTVAGGTENGDINVNAAVSWSANTTLTLTAANNININQAITATGASAGLALNAGRNINVNNAVRLDGASATLVMNYGGNYNIRTPASYSGVDPAQDPVLKPVLVSVDGPNGTKAGSVIAQARDQNGNPVYEVVRGDVLFYKNGNPVYQLVSKQVLEPVGTPDGIKAGSVLTPVYDKDGKPVYELVPGDQMIGPVSHAGHQRRRLRQHHVYQ
jgi:large exoprotein involved in heme utilization and adhesion